ncbi:MAG: DegV family protein [Clostridia bacterium]|nr:DegV family protein [Clostridia bacterium]
MSRKFTILVDSTADLGKDMRDKYDIDYAAMNYVLDEKEYPASLDWESHSAKEFYDLMRGGKIMKTTQVPGPVYEAKFQECADRGEDVLYISCSSALSGSINMAKMIAEEFLEDHPDMKIICVDPLISSLGQGYIAIKASELRSEGKSIEEVAKYIEDNRLKVHQIGVVADLKFLKQSGRVTATSAFFGNIFDVKPILISDTKGQNLAVKKIKGFKNALIETAQDVKNEVIDPSSQTLFISHADCPEDAEFWKNEITKYSPFKDCYISNIGPIVGASVGPGTIICYYLGDEVTL